MPLASVPVSWICQTRSSTALTQDLPQPHFGICLLPSLGHLWPESMKPTPPIPGHSGDRPHLSPFSFVSTTWCHSQGILRSSFRTNESVAWIRQGVASPNDTRTHVVQDEPQAVITSNASVVHLTDDPLQLLAKGLATHVILDVELKAESNTHKGQSGRTTKYTTRRQRRKGVENLQDPTTHEH